MTTIDFLTLDVEGAEYGILEAAFENNKDWNFNVANIEMTYQSTPAFGSSRLEMLYMLRSNGYWMQNHVGEDDIYVNRNNTNFLEMEMKESNPSECSRKNLEYMYKLLISNNFIPFSMAEREAILHKLDMNKDLSRLSNNTNVWLNGLIFAELSNNQDST